MKSLAVRAGCTKFPVIPFFFYGVHVMVILINWAQLLPVKILVFFIHVKYCDHA